MTHSVAGGNVETTKTLIRLKADINAQTTSGHTPLMHAVSRGHLDITKMLLLAGANVSEVNSWLETALIIAVCNKNHAAVELLLKRFFFSCFHE